MIVAANDVLQDPETAGQALKTIALRIRKTKAELTDMGEDAAGAAKTVSELRKQVLALSGVDIMKDENTYKSTYEILKEISQVYDKLTDKNRAGLLELLAGKNRANALASLLQNFNDAEGAMKTAQTASEGVGSAIKENSRYLDSIQGKLSKFKNAWQDLWDSTGSSDFLKGVIDIGTQIVKLTDDLGGLRAVLSSVGALVAGYNLPSIYRWFTKIRTEGTALSQFMGQMKTSLSATGSAVSNQDVSFGQKLRYLLFENVGAKSSGSTSATSALNDQAQQAQKAADSLQQVADATKATTVEAQNLATATEASTIASKATSAAEDAETVSRVANAAATDKETASTVENTTATQANDAAQKSLNATSKAGALIRSAGFLAVTLVINGLISAIQKQKQAEEEAKQASIETAKTTSDDYKKMQEAQQNYLDVTSDSSKTEDEVNNAVANVTSALGEKSKALQNVTADTDTYNKKLAEQIEQEGKLAETQLRIAERNAASDVTKQAQGFFGKNKINVKPGSNNSDILNTLQSTLGDDWKLENWNNRNVFQLNTTPKDIAALVAQIDKLEKAQQSLQDTRDRLAEQKAGIDPEADKKQYAALTQQINDYDIAIQNLSTAYSDDLKNSIDQYKDTLSDLLNTQINAQNGYTATASSLNKAKTEAYEYYAVVKNLGSADNLSQNQKDMIDGLVEALPVFQKMGDSAKDVKQEVSASAANIQKLQAKFSSLSNSVIKDAKQVTESVNKYKEAQILANETVVDGTAITKDQYDAIKELVGNDTDLTDIIRETTASTEDNTDATSDNKDATEEVTGAVIENAEALRELINQNIKASATYKEISEAQEEAKVQYNALQEAIYQVLTANRQLSDSDKDTLSYLESQADSIDILVDKYSALKTALTDSSNAYQNMSSAADADEQLDFSSQYQSLVTQLQESLDNRDYREAFTNALDAVVPDDFIAEKIKKGGTKAEAAAEYVGKLVSKGFLKNSAEEGEKPSYSIDGKQVKNFIQEGIKNGTFTSSGDLAKNTTLDKMISNYAKSSGITFTKDFLLAMMSEIGKRNENGNGYYLFDELAQWDDKAFSNKAEKVTYEFDNINTKLLDINNSMEALKNSDGWKAWADYQDKIEDVTKRNEELNKSVKRYQTILSDDDSSSQQRKQAKEAIDSAQEQIQANNDEISSLKDKQKAYADAKKSYDDLNAQKSKVNIEQGSVSDEALAHTKAYADEAQKVQDLQAKYEELKSTRDSLGSGSGKWIDANNQMQDLKDQIDACNKDMKKLGEPTQIEVSLSTDNLTKQINDAKKKLDDLVPDVIKQDQLYKKTNGKQGKKASDVDLQRAEQQSAHDPERQKIQNEIDSLSSTLTNIETQFENTQKSVQDSIETINSAYGDLSSYIKDNPLEVDYSSVTSAKDQVDSLGNSVNNVLGKDYTLNVKTNVSGADSVKFPTKTSTSTKKSAKAYGTNDAEGGKTLVGELGEELVVDPVKGQYSTVGKDGAEFVNLPKHAIVFPADKTKELLKNGKIKGRGRAMAKGGPVDGKYDYSKYTDLWGMSKKQLQAYIKKLYQESKDFDAQNPNEPASASHTQYGNIDVSNRQALTWDKATKDKYKDNYYAQSAELGSYSTLLGSDVTIGDYDIAFSPMVENPQSDQPTLLTEDMAQDYITDLINQLNNAYGQNAWTADQLLALDHQGTIWDDGTYIHDIIASIDRIDDDLNKSAYNGNAMHYSGQLWDAINVANQKYGKHFGTNLYNNLLSGKAHVRGGKIKPSNHKDLIGELGTELVVDPNKGTYSTYGTENGAQLVNLPKDAIVFDAQDTEKLLHGKNGARAGGEAFVNGNAYAQTSRNIKIDFSDDATYDKDSKKAKKKAKSAKDAAKEIKDTYSDIKSDIDTILNSMQDAVSRGALMLEQASDAAKKRADDIANNSGFQEIYKTFSKYVEESQKLSEGQGDLSKQDEINKGLADSYAKLSDAAKEAGVSTDDFISIMNGTWKDGAKIVQATTKDYLDAMKKLVDEQYKQGKVARSDYNSYMAEYYKGYADMYKDAASAISGYIDRIVNKINKQKDAMERQITLLNRQKDAIDRNYEMQERAIDAQTKALEKSKRPLEAQQTAIEDQAYGLQQQQKAIQDKEKPLKQQQKQLEKQSKELDRQKQILEDQITAIQDREKPLKKQQNLLDKQSKALDKQKQTLQDQITKLQDAEKPLQKQVDYISKQTDLLSRQQKAIEKSYKSQIDPLQEQLDALQKANEAREDAVDLQEKQYNLNKAMNQKTQLVFTGGSFSYQTNQSDVKSAQKDLNDAVESKQEKDLSNQIEDLQNARDKETGAINDQIDSLEEQQQVLQDQINAYEEQIDVINESVEAIERQQDALERQNDLLQEQIDALEEQIDLINESVDSIERQQDALQRQSDLLQDQIDIYEEQVDAIQDTIDALDEQSAAIDRQIALIDRQVDKLNTYKSDLEDVKDLQDQAIEDQIDKIQLAEEPLDDAIDALGRYQQAFQDIVDLWEQNKDMRLLDQLFGTEWQQAIQALDPTLIDNFGTAYVNSCASMGQANTELLGELNQFNNWDASPFLSTIQGMADNVTSLKSTIEGQAIEKNPALAYSKGAQTSPTTEGTDFTKVTTSSGSGVFAIMPGIDTSAPETDMSNLLSIMQDFAGEFDQQNDDIALHFASVWGTDSVAGSGVNVEGILGVVDQAERDLDSILNTNVIGDMNTFQTDASTTNGRINDNLHGTLQTIRSDLSTFYNPYFVNIVGQVTTTVTNAAETFQQKMQEIVDSLKSMVAEAKSAFDTLNSMSASAQGMPTAPSASATVPAAKNGLEVTGYASGGVVQRTPTLGSALTKIASTVGEDTMVAVRKGERVLSVSQTENFDQLVKLTPELIASSKDLMKYSKLFNNINVDASQTERNIENGIKKVLDKSQLNNITNNNNTYSISMGDINVSGVQDVDSFANAVKNEFPNKMLQILMSK